MSRLDAFSIPCSATSATVAGALHHTRSVRPTSMASRRRRVPTGGERTHDVAVPDDAPHLIAAADGQRADVCVDQCAG